MAKRFNWLEIKDFLEARKREGASYKTICAELEANFNKKITVARLSQVFKSFKEVTLNN